MNQKPKTVDEVIADLESQLHHPTRQLAQQLVMKHRRKAIDPAYRFEDAPRELKQTIYNMTVKYSAHHSWWSRFRRQ